MRALGTSPMCWDQVSFLDVCDIQGGTQPPKDEWISDAREGYVRMLQIRDFTQPGRAKIEYVKDSSKLKKCDNEDILIGRYGASVGKILHGLSGAYNVAIAKCILDHDRIDRDYLLMWLQSSHFQNSIQNFGGRAAQAGFNKNDLGELQIPLPPLEEQKRIAGILDAADILRAKRREALSKLDDLLQSTFLDLFGDPVTNPKGWEAKKLEDLCLGITDIDHKMPKAVESGIPFVSAKDLADDGSISFEDVKQISEEDFKRLARKGKPQKGDIIYSRIGVKLGKARLVEVDFEFLASYSCCTIKPNTRLMHRHFLCYLLDSPFILRQAHSGVRAIAVPDLGLGKIKAFKIITPPFDLQQRFAEIVSSVEEQKAKMRKHLEQLDDLFASLQQRAFRGDL